MVHSLLAWSHRRHRIWMLDLMAPVKQPVRKHYIAHPISGRSSELRALTFSKTSVKARGTPGHTARVGSDLENGRAEGFDDEDSSGLCNLIEMIGYLHRVPMCVKCTTRFAIMVDCFSWFEVV